MREEQHAIADVLDFVHVVRGPEDPAGAVFGDGADRATQVLRGRGIERGGRLVEQQQRRLVQHRLGERDARLLAGRQHAAFRVAEAAQIEAVEHRVDARADVADVVEQPEQGQVLQDRKVARQRRVDRREVRALERAGAVAREIDAFDRDRARARLEHAQDHVDRRRLAGAVRAEQADDLVAAHRERDAVDRDGRGIALRKVANGEDGLGGRRGIGRGHGWSLRKRDAAIFARCRGRE